MIRKTSLSLINLRKNIVDRTRILYEIDEQWSFIGNEKRQHCLWYVFDIRLVTTDDWVNFSREVEPFIHLTRIIFTQ